MIFIRDSGALSNWTPDAQPAIAKGAQPTATTVGKWGGAGGNPHHREPQGGGGIPWGGGGRGGLAALTIYCLFRLIGRLLTRMQSSRLMTRVP